MRVAAVTDERGYVVPLPHGPVVVVYDTESGQEERHENPAPRYDRAKRAAVVEFLHRLGVEAVCSVPGTFCQTSHGLAQRHGMRFLLIEDGTTWQQVREKLNSLLARAVLEVPPELLHRHGAGHDHEHHDHGHHPDPGHHAHHRGPNDHGIHGHEGSGGHRH